MTDYDLTDLGIGDTREIEGTLTRLRARAGQPIVFLFDEHHTTPACIQQNIQNAEELINKAGVKTLGVETHVLGAAADQLSAYSAQTTFANHFIGRAGLSIEGIECRDVADQLHLDIGMAIWPGVTVASHMYDHVRSPCHIASLVRFWKRDGLEGNAVLNLGAHHNNDIRALLDAGLLDGFVGIDASYIRLRPTAYS